MAMRRWLPFLLLTLLAPGLWAGGNAMGQAAYGYEIRNGSADPAGYVDGLSLYRGYFAPNGVDPTGMEVENNGEPIFFKIGKLAHEIITKLYQIESTSGLIAADQVITDAEYAAGIRPTFGSGRPDIAHVHKNSEFSTDIYEIKPDTENQRSIGAGQLRSYVTTFNLAAKAAYEGKCQSAQNGQPRWPIRPRTVNFPMVFAGVGKATMTFEGDGKGLILYKINVDAKLPNPDTVPYPIGVAIPVGFIEDIAIGVAVAGAAAVGGELIVGGVVASAAVKQLIRLSVSAQ